MRRLFIVLSTAFLPLSCCKEEPRTIEAVFLGTSPMTVVKSAGDDDLDISRLDLFVFRSADGLLEARASADSLSPLSVSLTRGRKMSWFMFANAPEGYFPHVGSLDEFMRQTVLLEDGPLMHAKGDTAFLDTGTTVKAMLKRYACKVGIRDISIAWTDALPCRVTKAVLLNVQGSAPLSGEPADLELRYNCGVIDELGYPLDGMLEACPGVEITDSQPVQLDIRLSCMPNPSDGNSYGLPWQPRRTRVALCLNILGEDNWYPIDLPPMEGNCFYYVESIVIKGPGAAGADLPPERTSADFIIRVREWTESDTNVDFSTDNE